MIPTILIIKITLVVYNTTTTIVTVIIPITVMINNRFPAHDELGTCRTNLVSRNTCKVCSRPHVDKYLTCTGTR